MGVRKSSERKGGLRSERSDSCRPHLGESSSELTRESVDVCLREGGGGRLSCIDEGSIRRRVGWSSKLGSEEVRMEVDRRNVDDRLQGGVDHDCRLEGGEGDGCWRSKRKEEREGRGHTEIEESSTRSSALLEPRSTLGSVSCYRVLEEKLRQATRHGLVWCLTRDEGCKEESGRNRGERETPDDDVEILVDFLLSYLRSFWSVFF